MEESRAAGNVTALMTADRCFHAAVVEAGGNQLLTDLYQRLRDRQVRVGVAAMRAEPERMEQAVTEHTRLLDALRGDDPARWAEYVEAHIETATLRLRARR